MILDKENLFSDDQAITATANSTNVIDLGNDSSLVKALNEKGANILIQATEAFTAAGAATLTVALQSDNDEAFGSAKTIWTSEAISKDDLVAGYKFPLKSLPEIDEQYLRLVFTVATGPMTAGKIKAGLVMDHQTNG